MWEVFPVTEGKVSSKKLVPDPCMCIAMQPCSPLYVHTSCQHCTVMSQKAYDVMWMVTVSRQLFSHTHDRSEYAYTDTLLFNTELGP